MELIKKLADLPLSQVKGVQGHISRQFAEIVNRSATACIPELREEGSLDSLPPAILQDVHLNLARSFPWITPSFAQALHDLIAETSEVPDNDIIDLATRYLSSAISVLSSNFNVLYELGRERQDDGVVLAEILLSLHPFALLHFQEYLVWRQSDEGLQSVPDSLLDRVWLEKAEKYFPEAMRGSLRKAPKNLFCERYKEQVSGIGPLSALDAAFLNLTLIPR